MLNGPVVTAINTDDDYSYGFGGNYTSMDDPGFSFYSSGVMKQDQRPDSPQFSQTSSLTIPENGDALVLAQTKVSAAW